jgi:hypothetical protein
MLVCKKDEWMEGRKDGRMEGWMEKRMNGWKDGKTEGWKAGRAPSITLYSSLAAKLKLLWIPFFSGVATVFNALIVAMAVLLRLVDRTIFLPF